MRSKPDGPVFRIEPDRRPAFAHASADGRVVAFLHDLQTRPGKIAFHFTVTGGRVDLETACGREAQFDLALFQVDLDGMGWRSGGPKFHVPVRIRDFHAVLEVSEGDVLLTSRDFEWAVDAVQFERTDFHVEAAGELLSCHVGSRGFEVQGLA